MLFNIYNMVKIFGRKISKGNLKTLGRKIGRTANVVGRKALNTIDKAAPIAALTATALGHPEIGAAITAGQGLAHATDHTVRAGVSVAGSKKANLNKRLVTFGDSVNETADQGRETHALLRQ
jgi:uncharacterized protein (DUF697 family)